MNDQPTLLLDTHAWIWFVGGKRQAAPLSHLARDKKLSVSAISLWETAMLDVKGRLHLAPDALSWLKAALAPLNISLLPLTPEIGTLSSRLPGRFHGDPADRIILATAIIHQIPLATADAAIIRYGRSRKLSILAL